MGNPISFKNKKSIFRRKNGKPFIATKPEYKQWMERAVRIIASQLYSASAIGSDGITPECLKRFVTYSLPPDDCWEDLEIGSVRTILVPKGEEGADIQIERMDITPEEAAARYAEIHAEVRKEMS